MRQFAKFALALVALASVSARADVIPYPTLGTENPIGYTFTALTTGDVKAYFFEPSSASFENVLGLNVNGVSTGIFGLDNHSSSPGDVLDFGTVNAGDTLVFVMRNLHTFGSPPSLGDAFSDRTMNG